MTLPLIRPSRELALLGSLYCEADDVLRGDETQLCGLRVSVSAWSPAQHIGHLALVNEAAFRNVETLLGGGGEPRGRCNLIGLAVLAFGRIPRGRTRAPESVRPGDAVSRRDAEEALKRTSSVLARLEDKALLIGRARGRIRHLVLGTMNASEWLRFARIHTRHHLRIVREISALTSAG